MTRNSAVATGLFVGCVAGVLAFLAASPNVSTSLSGAPAGTASRVQVVPSATSTSSRPVAVPVESFDAEEWQQATPQTQTQVTSWTTFLAGLVSLPLAALGVHLLKKRDEERLSLMDVDLFTVGKQALVASAVVGASASMVDVADAYPIFAQQGFTNPREATGRIVCANCHLAAKPTEIEMPQAVFPDQVFQAVTKIPDVSIAAPVDASSVVGTVMFDGSRPVEFVQESGIPVSQDLLNMEVPSTPDTVFKATIKVPYDSSLKQVGAKGKPADFNVGAVLILPEGFKLAPPERIPEKMKEEMNGLSFIQYSEDQPNILVVGPVPGKLYEEMSVALLSPDPATNKDVHFGTLPVYVGGNRGRGQLYPNGEKSNNNVYNAIHSGTIADIELDAKKRIYTLAISEADGNIVNEQLLPGQELIVKKGDKIVAGQALTTNPNVGGFGQTEDEIVLQDPNRIYGFLLMSFAILTTQVMLVVKKKQWEQVQLAEMNF